MSTLLWNVNWRAWYIMISMILWSYLTTMARSDYAYQIWKLKWILTKEGDGWDDLDSMLVTQTIINRWLKTLPWAASVITLPCSNPSFNFSCPTLTLTPLCCALSSPPRNMNDTVQLHCSINWNPMQNPFFTHCKNCTATASMTSC